jgi:uncharacterized membrane protein YccC
VSAAGADPGTTRELPTVTGAARQAALRGARFDPRLVSLRSGLVAALPVAAMLALGTALHRPAATVTLGVGAILVGMAWRAGDAPVEPPLATMGADAIVLAAATVLGTVAGRYPALHLVLLAALCLIAGLATALGRGGAVVGTQAIIAYTILGAFPEPLGPALALGGLVLAGGVAQVAACALLARPPAHRRQRAAVAAALRSLAAQARDPQAPAATSAVALDAAELALALPAVFGSPELATLTELIAAGRRIRLELTALGSASFYAARTDPEHAERLGTALRDATARIADALALAAAALEGGPEQALRLRDAALALGAWGAARAPLPVAPLEQGLAALTGRVGATLRQVLLASGFTTDGMGAWTPPPARRRGPLPRPSAGSWRRLASGLRTDVRKLRDAARRDAPAGRHALRLAVVVPLTELLAQVTSLPHGQWAVLAVATVLRPEFGATLTRGVERVIGTLAGVVLATLMAVALNPGGWGAAAALTAIAYGTFAVFSASFAAGVAGLTAVIVFLIHTVSPVDTAQLAFDRGLDTVIGGALGLAAYAAWPTWSARSLPHRMATLITAQGDYLALVLGALIAGAPADGERLRGRARAARMAWGDAEALLRVTRMEPARGGTGPGTAARMLQSLRRVVYAVHALRVGVGQIADPTPHPELEDLRRGLLAATATLASRAGGEAGPAAMPPLRARYRQIAWGPQHGLPDSVRIPIDELIDALDSLALVLGIELPTG